MFGALVLLGRSPNCRLTSRDHQAAPFVPMNRLILKVAAVPNRSLKLGKSPFDVTNGTRRRVRHFNESRASDSWRRRAWRRIRVPELRCSDLRDIVPLLFEFLTDGADSPLQSADTALHRGASQAKCRDRATAGSAISGRFVANGVRPAGARWCECRVRRNTT